MEVIYCSLKRFGAIEGPDSGLEATHVNLDRILVAFNGGKDCTILLHLILLGIQSLATTTGRIRLVYFRDVPEETFSEVEEFVEEVKNRYNMECIEVNNGNMKIAMEYIVQNHAEVNAIFMGTRSTDPNAGWMDYICSTSAGWPSMNLVAPLLHMSYAEVWRIIHELQIPYCSLYSRGYTSIGKRSNTLPNPLLNNGSEFLHADQLMDETKERLGRS
jgi:FAD synthetase